MLEVSVCNISVLKGFLNYLKKLTLSSDIVLGLFVLKFSMASAVREQHLNADRRLCVLTGRRSNCDWHSLHPSPWPCQTKQLSMVKSHAPFQKWLSFCICLVTGTFSSLLPKCPAGPATTPQLFFTHLDLYLYRQWMYNPWLQLAYPLTEHIVLQDMRLSGV